MFMKFSVVPSDSVCCLGKAYSGTFRVRHSTVSQGVADRRCILDCTVFLLVSDIGHIKSSD